MAMLPLHAQNLDPELQRMTDEVIRWSQEQFQKYGAVDQKKLDSMNLAIRLKQSELENSRAAKVQTADSAAGKVINVAMMQGNTITVPPGKRWKVKQVTCQTGIGEYSILVTSVKFREEYLPGEKIVMPGLTPEASLLTSDMSAVTYNFKIIESEIK